VLQHIKVRPNWVTAFSVGIMAGSGMTAAAVFLAGAR